MIGGLLIAVLVTAAWMLAQIGAMHIRPARNRLKSMALGYVVSLPFVYLACRWFLPAGAAWAPGLLHAYVFHLLLFLFYVECFYHVERSVTLRFLMEILLRGEAGARLHDIQGEYSLDAMILARLEVLAENGFVEKRGDEWHLLAKGRLFATLMGISCWIFQSETQRERM
jgi:hypothetical protein